MSKEAAKDLYQDLAARHPSRLTELVHSDFSGTISAPTFGKRHFAPHEKAYSDRLR